MQEIKKMLFDGTDDDFKRIVDSYKLLLYSVVYAASAHADADDIVQETFIYAYYHWGMLRDKEKLSSWLCAIAKNKASHAMRTAGKRVSMEKLGNRLCVSSPESTFLRREERMEIREKLYALSEKYREAVMLYYFAGKSISEISSLLEVPEGTVKFRLHEGRKKLKEELIHMMNGEKKQVKEKNVWENIKAELHLAQEAFHAHQKGEANAICDILIEQFKDMDPALLSKEEIRVMIRVYNQKFYANMHLPYTMQPAFWEAWTEIALTAKRLTCVYITYDKSLGFFAEAFAFEFCLIILSFNIRRQDRKGGSRTSEAG